LGIIEHGSEHTADLAVEGREFCVLGLGDAITVEGKIEGGIGLGVFAIAVCEFLRK